MAMVNLRNNGALQRLYQALNLDMAEDGLGTRLMATPRFRTIADVANLSDTERCLGHFFVMLYPEHEAAYAANPDAFTFEENMMAFRRLVLAARRMEEEATKTRFSQEEKEEGVAVSHIGNMVREVCGRYGYMVLENKTPGQKVWSIVAKQIERQNLYFIPWSKWVSLEDERRAIPKEVRRLKINEQNDIELVNDDDCPSTLRGFARILQVCTMRKILYVAEGLCLPARVDYWTEKMLQAFHPTRLQPGMRAPTFKELEEADRIFWSEVFRLANTANTLEIEASLTEAVGYAEVLQELQPRLADAQKQPDQRQKPKQHVNNKEFFQARQQKQPQPTPVARQPQKNVNNNNNSSKNAAKNRRKRENQNKKRKNGQGASGQNNNNGYQVPLNAFFPHSSNTPYSDYKITVHDGAATRVLRDGGGLGSPGVLQPKDRPFSSFWEECQIFIGDVADSVFEKVTDLNTDSLFAHVDKIVEHRKRFAKFLTNDPISTDVKFPQPFCLDILKNLASRAGDEDCEFLAGLENGVTIGFHQDLGENPRVFPSREKFRDYDPAKKFRGNYPSAGENADALKQTILKEVSAGRMKGPFSKSDLLEKWPDAHVCAVGVELKDLIDKSKIRVLVDGTQGGVNQGVKLTMIPTRPCLADVLRILDFVHDPVSVKWDAANAHRNILVPETEWGLVSICLEDDEFYVNTVGTFGVASAGQNWDRVASFVHRSCLRMLGKEAVFLFLFSDDTILVCEKSERDKIVKLIFTLCVLIGYPLTSKKFWFEQNCLWLGFEIDLHKKSARICEVKRRFTLEKLEIVKSAINVTREDVDSLTGSLQWASQLRPLLRPFLASLYNLMSHGKAQSVIPQSVLDDLRPWERFLRQTDFFSPVVRPLPTTSPSIFTDACAKGIFDEEKVNWASPYGIGGFLLDDSGNVKEWFACAVTSNDFPWLSKVSEAHTVIAFMELLATSVAIHLWCRPATSCESQLEITFPSMSTDNLGNVYILQKFYTSKAPGVFLLIALAEFCIDNNIRPVVSHLKGDAGPLTDLADKLSRNLTTLDPSTRRTVIVGDIAWLEFVRRRPLIVEDCVFNEKRSTRKLKHTAKVGEGPSNTQRLPKRFKAIRKDKRRRRELEIAQRLREEEGGLDDEHKAV